MFAVHQMFGILWIHFWILATRIKLAKFWIIEAIWWDERWFRKFFVHPKSTFYRHYIIDSHEHGTSTSFWQVKVITELWDDQMISDCPGNRRILSAEFPIQISLWFTIWELKSPYDSPNLPNIIEWCRSCIYIYICYIYIYTCVCVHLKRAELRTTGFLPTWSSSICHWIGSRKDIVRGRACNTSVIGLRGVVSKGRGQGTLRILRKD